MHIHLIAIAGTGMASLAGLCQAAGHRVTGSDVAFYPPMGPALKSWGIELYEGFDPAHLEPAPDWVVVGNVCRPHNPEARAAIDRGLRVTTMVHALRDLILDGTQPLVVAGTHGKTTTSAMCAWALTHCGLSPGFLIGGLPGNFDRSFALPSPAAEPPRPFVIEGDEYDTAFFEKTPKFWHYPVHVGVLTSIEHDHIDIYPDHASYVSAFEGFVERVPPTGLLVAHAADPQVVDVVQRRARAPVSYYALAEDDLLAAPSPHFLAARVPSVPGEEDEVQSFDLFIGGSAAGRFRLAAAGAHNLRNALAALAATCQGFGGQLLRANAALKSFAGVRRRQELIGRPGGVAMYDDFAHHPTAVGATIKALRERHTEGKLWVIYEPRSATACRSLHQRAYEKAFAGADYVLLAPLGRDEIPASQRLDVHGLARKLRNEGVEAQACGNLDAIVQRVCDGATAGDAVALLSNGAFGGLCQRLSAALGERASKASPPPKPLP